MPFVYTNSTPQPSQFLLHWSTVVWILLSNLTHGEVDLDKSVEGDDDEEVEILERLELQKRMSRIQAYVELDGNVGVQVNIVGVDVVLKDNQF